MAMKWIEEVRQTAIIDEAEQLANRMLSPEFAPFVAIYAVIGFDAIAFATALLADARAARAARSGSVVQQVSYEVESGHSRDAVTECGTWFDHLRLAGRFASTNKHPFGAYVERLAAARELSADSWSRARDSLDAVLTHLRTADLTGSGVSAEFVARGEALAVRLDRERTDTGDPWLARAAQTEKLQEILGAIVDAFERVAAARDLAMALTGKNIPGLELSLVRGAAASSSGPSGTSGDGTPGL
jgi:hypothetical protein